MTQNVENTTLLDLYDSWDKHGTMEVSSRTEVACVIYKMVDKEGITNYKFI